MNSSFIRNSKDSAIALVISMIIASMALLFFANLASAQSAIKLPDGASTYSSFDLKNDTPLQVTVIRTDKLAAGGCGPKFVGRIEWGDGAVTEQPTATTMECGSNTSISASHTYKAAGNYTVRVTLDNQVRILQTVSVSGGGDTNWIHAPSGDCAWWKLGGLVYPCNPDGGGGLNATPLPRPTGGDTNAVPVSPTPAPTVTRDTNWITYAPQAVSGFVKGVASAIARPVMGVIPFVKGMFGLNQAEQPSNDLWGLIPMPPEGDGFKSIRTINDIKATVVNQSLTREASCQAGRGDKFEAHVVTTTDEIVIYDCATGTAPADYARVIVDVLTNQHGFAGLTVDTLLKKSFQIGVEMPRPGDTGIIKSDTVSPDTSTINNLDIGLQIKVTDKNGRLVKDWSSSSVTIDSTDQIYLRWNADKFTQCLPFFADNGQYAFSKLNSKLVSGNTETEKYNLTERSGPYLLECASKVNAFDVQTAIIYVTVKSNTVSPSPDISGLPVQPSSNFKVAVSNTNPLNVSITRTVPSGECGPKYVGTIDWGDGTVEPQPQEVTRECGLFSSTTASHTYKMGGQYTVSVKLDGVTAMVTQVTVFAPFDAPN